MSELKIEAANLSAVAVNFFNCPSKLYSLSEIADELALRTRFAISELDVSKFREKYLGGQTRELVPLVDPNIAIKSPQTLDELASHAMADTMGIRTGVLHEAFGLFTSAKDGNDLKSALSALDLLNKTSDSIDKKMKQLSPNSDPASIVFGMKEFQKLKSALNAVADRHPEWNLWDEFEKELQAQAAKDAEYTDVGDSGAN